MRIRVNNEVLPNKEKVDKNEFDKDKAKSHMIVGLMTLVLYFIGQNSV